MLERWRADKKEQLASFLQSKVGGSKKQIRRALEKNCCRINGRIERFGSAWVEKNHIVEYLPPQATAFSWTTLLDHPDFMIASKPPGWVCDEASCCKTFGPNVHLTHRLDKDTTGALLLAKSLSARDALMDLFAKRQMQKAYLALVDGVLREDTGVCDTFLAKKGPLTWGSAKTGVRAVTRWRVLQRGKTATLLACEPITGRTHQIRVHMAEIGHPILVDRAYAQIFTADLLARRPLLHAFSLQFVYEGAAICVQAPLPYDFLESLSLMDIQHSFAEM